MKINEIRMATLGGTLCSIWTSITFGDLLQTAAMAAVGTLVSYGISQLLPRKHKRQLTNSTRYWMTVARFSIKVDMYWYVFCYLWSSPAEVGKEVSLAALKGKVVFLDFYYTGCGNCITYYKNTVSGAEAHFEGNDDVVFVAVSIDGRREIGRIDGDKVLGTSCLSPFESYFL